MQDLLPSIDGASAIAHPYFSPPSKPTHWIGDQEFEYDVLGGSRPALLLTPKGDDKTRDLPLVILLHATGGNEVSLDRNFGHRLSAGVNERQYFLLTPVARPNRHGDTFWDMPGSSRSPNSGDIAYLEGLIREAKAAHRIDPRRVYVIGNSIGGVMAYQLACAAPREITAVVSIAAAMPEDDASCKGVSPVSVLNIHGKSDFAVPQYDADYDHDGDPSNDDLEDDPLLRGTGRTLAFWAKRAGCEIFMTEHFGYLDLIDQQLTELRPFMTRKEIGSGEETEVIGYRKGCPPGTSFENWIHDAGHRPFFDFRREKGKPDAASKILGWLFERVKPT